MRRFNSSVLRLKNSAGEYEGMVALRGYNSYELAKQFGFKGTEAEWMESLIGDGWIGAFQELEATQLKSFVYLATIHDDWTNTQGFYTQTIAVDGILATDRPHITPVYSTEVSIANMQKETWDAISKAETGDGTITFTCFEDIPEAAITVQIEVIR